MAAAGLIDPTKTGKYPVLIGEGLLGNSPNEIFTGIRYNHKPALSSNSAPSQARLKPSIPGKTTSYDLTYTDNDNKYAYQGTRNTDGNQYVLYFDPARQAFILDKLDSTFNMNVTLLPDNADPESVRRQHPPIQDGAPPSKAKSSKDGASQDKSAPKPAAKARTKETVQKKEPKRKPEKRQAPKNFELSLPQPEKEKPKPENLKPSAKAAQDDDEEEDDDDDLLQVEYPQGPGINKTKHTDFSPAFPSVQKFDDFMNQRESEGDDADGEDDDEIDMDFQLPSPVNNLDQQQKQHSQNDQQHQQEVAEPEPMDEDEDDDGADLEKELANAFEELENSQEGGSPHGDGDGDESEISEED